MLWTIESQKVISDIKTLTGRRKRQARLLCPLNNAQNAFDLLNIISRPISTT